MNVVQQGITLMALLVAASGVPNANAASTENLLEMSAGTAWSTGSYGRTFDTDVKSFSIGGRYRFGRTTLQARLPYLSVSGPPGVQIGPDGQPYSSLAQSAGAITRRAGVGDATLGVAYSLLKDTHQHLDARFIVKLATGDVAQRLSTGRNDYSLEARYQYQVAGFAPFAILGYRFVGRPSGLALRDTPYATFGTSLQLTPRWSAGASLQWRGSVVSARPDSTLLAVFARARIGQPWELDTYVARGFGTSAPDLTAGVSLVHRFR